MSSTEISMQAIAISEMPKERLKKKEDASEISLVKVWSNTCFFQLQAWHLIWSLRAMAEVKSCDAFAMHYYCHPLTSQLLSLSRSLILGLSTANGYSKGIQLAPIPWSCDFMIHACIKTSSNWGNKSGWGLWNETQQKLNYQVGIFNANSNFNFNSRASTVSCRRNTKRRTVRNFTP